MISFIRLLIQAILFWHVCLCKGKKNTNSTLSTGTSAAVNIRSTSNSSSFYHIYSPVKYWRLKTVRTLLGPPEVWIQSLSDTYRFLDNTTVSKTTLPPVRERARDAYLELIRGLVLGLAFGRAERSIKSDTSNEVVVLNLTLRSVGEDITYLGQTMIGVARMNSFQELLIQMITNQIAGDIVETGVWKGGASIFARALLRSYNESHRRVILCDSFKGLPKGNASFHQGDVGWSDLSILSVSDYRVAKSFFEFNLFDNNVVFAKGFFRDTMPVLTRVIDQIAILRMDGDIYESTVDVLYHLYEKISLNGIVIVDDWEGFPAKDACLDFFQVHQIQPIIVPVDRWSVYFVKTKAIKVQFWRYKEKKFKA
jgi:hypothetical protein